MPTIERATIENLKPAFDDPWVEDLKKYHGAPFELLGPEDPAKYDRHEVGEMWRVRFPDGFETSAFPEEIDADYFWDGSHAKYTEAASERMLRAAHPDLQVEYHPVAGMWTVHPSRDEVPQIGMGKTRLDALHEALEAIA